MRQLILVITILITIILIPSLLICQYDYGLDICGQDVRIDGKLDLHSGGSSIAVGSAAGILSTGLQNTFVGTTAGDKNTSGSQNTFIGNFTGHENETGSGNTFVGKSAGLSSKNGSFNTFVGRNAGGILIGDTYTVDRSIAIGFWAGQGIMASDRLIISNNQGNQPLIFGEFDNQKLGINWNGTTPVDQTLSVNGEASKTAAGDWIANSDARLKKDIQYLNSSNMLDKLLSMKAVSYTWDDQVTGFDRPTGTQYGFIAQDLQKVWPENVKVDSQGYLQTGYGTYDHMYVEAIKELAKENEMLKAKVRNLTERLDKEIANIKAIFKIESSDLTILDSELH